MQPIDFDRSTLFISARSPFARRVRLAFREHALAYDEKILDVFKPTPELIALNPLCRVPTLKLASGDVLIDSEKILQSFYLSHSESSLLPKSREDWLLASHWSAIATGLCEKTVEYYFETLRPESARDAEAVEEVRQIAQRTLERFNEAIGERETILSSGLSQADLDMGAALAYLSLRYSSQWKSRYTRAGAYLSRLESRASFQETKPPAA